MRKIMILVSLLAFSHIIKAQEERYTVLLSAGQSNLLKQDNDNSHDYANFYTGTFAFKTGIEYKLTDNNKTLYPTAGISVSLKGAVNNEAGSVPPNSWPERLFTTDIYTNINYSFEPWLIFSIGLQSSFPMLHYTYKEENNKLHFAYLDICGRVSIKVQRYSLNTEYCLGATRVMYLPWTDLIYYNERMFTIGLGYSF